jgi:gas vesicle protein
MSEMKNFWKGIILGALAGGALSLLDTPTRKAVTINVRKASTQVGHVLREPSIIVEKVKETASQVRETVEQVSEDVLFIKEKVGEITEVTPQVMDMVKETKDAFSKSRDTYEETTTANH